MADSQKDHSFNRRDFLKLGAIGLGGLVVGGLELGVEYGNNAYSMAARVCNKMFEAEMSNDPRRIEDSKKLAFIWLFAETARQNGKLVGYEKAGAALGHYMYGESQSLDVSNWLKEDSENNKNFWPRLLSDMRYSIVKEEHVDDVRALRMLRKRLKKGHSFMLEANSEDLFSAIGISTCTAQAKLEFEFDETTDQIQNKRLSEISLQLKDWYDWDGMKNPADMGYKGMDFAKGFFGGMRTAILNNNELVIKTLAKLNLPSVYLDQLKSVYSDGVFDFFGNLSDGVGIISSELENAVTNGDGIYESELSLLESVGAKQYQIYGRMHHSGTVVADE